MYAHTNTAASPTAIAPHQVQATEVWPPAAIILEHVAVTYGISVQHLQSKRRDFYTVEAKRVAIHLLAASGQGLSASGRLLCLHHSTVHHHLHHAVLDRWQQQFIAELQTELQHMAARVQLANNRSRNGSVPTQQRSIA